MAVSRRSLANYNIPNNYWFATNSDRDTYFINHAGELITSIYCAVGGDPASTDYDVETWILQQYNGYTWVVCTVSENYALTITNKGLQALIKEETGEAYYKITRIKMIDSAIINPTTPLINWTDSDFTAAGGIVINWGTSTEINKHVTYRYTLANGGMQYTITLKPEDINIYGEANFYIGAIGIYVQSQNTGEDVLFGIACLPSSIYKIGTTVESGIGNSLKFYLNTVLTNIGYISNLTNLEQEVTSVAEVDTELDLSYNGGIADPYNLYVVDDLNSTGLPALAVRQGNPVDDNLSWNYFTPSDNIINLTASAFASDVQNYMAVRYDSTTNKYVKADGSESWTMATAIRVGNNLIFAGSIRNPNTTSFYNYTYSINNGGIGYNVNDKLRIAITYSRYLIATVTAVDSNGTITALSYNLSYGSNLLSGLYNLYYVEGERVTGSGAILNISSTSPDTYQWNFTASELNKPVYADTGVNAGKITTTPTSSFIGWVTSTNSIKLGLDNNTQATETVYGVTRYATNTEVASSTTAIAANLTTAVTPKRLQDNYIQKTLVAGNPGESAANPVTVNTYTSWSKPIVSTVNGVGFQGTAYRAEWADLAEYYKADKAYPAGTLITIGSGVSEISEAITECNGIISEKPGYVLGKQDSEKDLPVALVGKVAVLFDNDCSINFGDKIYLSSKAKGRASTIPNGNCLGKVIEKECNGKIKVLCSVRINF